MKILALLIAMAATLATCNALNCYACSGFKNEGCGEAFNVTSATKVPCETACLKTVTIAVIGSYTHYTRKCADEAPSSLTCSKNEGEINGVKTGSFEACFCNSELCNSASNLLPSIVQTIMIVTAAFFYQKF